MADILGLDLARLGGGQVADALLRDPVELAQMRHALGIDELVGVDAGAFHFAIVGRDAPGRLQVRHHVQRLGVHAHEIEEPPRFLPVRHRVRLERMDHVGELDGVPDEEHLEVVADEVPIAVHRLELDREAARIALGLGRFLGARNGREPHEHRCLHAGLVEDPGAGVFGRRLVADLAIGLEIAVRPGAPGMHHALGDPLAVEMCDLFDELIVLERRRAAFADRPGRLVVPHRMALAGCEDMVLVAHEVLRCSVGANGVRKGVAIGGSADPALAPLERVDGARHAIICSGHEAVCLWIGLPVLSCVG